MHHRWKALLAGAIATCAFALPAATTQAAEIGQTCNTLESYWVLSVPLEGPYALYVLGVGAGFYIEGFSGDYYRGHGNGQLTGYFWRADINQATCHW